MDPTTITEFLGLTPDQTAALITIGALSTSFFFVWNAISAPIARLILAIKNYFIREINLHISEPDYNKVNLWLEQHKKYILFQRSYKVVTAKGTTDDDVYDEERDKKKSKNRLITGFGTVVVIAPDHPIMFVRRKKEQAKQIYQQTETLDIRFLTLKPERIIKFFNEVTNIIEDDGPYVWEANDHWWAMRGAPKPISTPVGAGATQMIESVETFINSRDNYTKRNLPFKRGFLLYGEPGTGKTSILSYIAQKHGLNIYTINSDSVVKIGKLANYIKPNSMIVFEDIDLSIVGQSRVDEDGDEVEHMGIMNKDALNSLLNAVDGIVEFNGNIIVATMNKNPSTLDPAMLRPGRIDECIEIGLLTSDDQITHFNNFFETDFKAENYDLPHRTFAEMQLICTINMMDADAAIQHLMLPRENNKFTKSYL